ncbi:MAG: bacteriohemerythrin [Thermodesulfobacteriota bacterium]
MPLAWKNEYSVNIREIDDQHRQLVSMINELDRAMLQGQGKQALGTILGSLISYAGSHFATEERLMRQHGFPGYEEHAGKHAKMTEKVLDLARQHEAGRPALTIEVMKFLQDWLDKHILGTDKKYGPFLNAKGVI